MKTINCFCELPGIELRTTACEAAVNFIIIIIIIIIKLHNVELQNL